jgi:N-acyl-phosphatidylethanolamine-hydrolysing phospholipase D
MRALAWVLALAAAGAIGLKTGCTAPVADAGFKNRAPPDTGADAGWMAHTGLWLRKAWTSIVPRTGGAEQVAYDVAAGRRDPSLTWIGHASFLVRLDGAAFLTDPMFSERASPVSFAGPRRAVPPGIALEALPKVDFALLSHNHYDHADEDSVRRLAARGVRFIVPLGLGEWVRAAGGQTIELNWWQSVQVAGLTVHCVPARHFSGRSLSDKDRSLWAGWVVSGPSRRFYHTGDTAYAPDFGAIRERLGPVDLAAVPIGAYAPAAIMRAVHTTPEEGLRIGLDVAARHIVAMHFGTFDLADEPLDEPPRRFRDEVRRLGLEPDRAWVMKVGETRDW